MGFVINSADFIEYLKICADKMNAEKDVIAQLDSASDKDYGWKELATAFSELNRELEPMGDMPVYVVLRRMGLLLLGRVGSDCAMLFGSGYISASRRVEGRDTLNCEELCQVFDAICRDMMSRSKSKPGNKSVIDAIYPAATKFTAYIDAELDETQILQKVKKAALDGAFSTKSMQASDTEDVGAHVMALRIACICDFITTRLIK